MAILSITSILVDSPAGEGSFVSGEAIEDGEVVYLDSVTGKVKLAFCNGTAAQATATGFALNSAILGQPLTISNLQVMTINTGAAPSILYFLAATPGKIFLESDLVATNYKSIICVGNTATTLIPRFWNTGIVKP
jgi:hypothetical protein